MTSTDHSVPTILAELAQKWHADESEQPPARWFEGPWVSTFSDLTSWLQSVPNPIGRQSAAELAAGALQPDGARTAFIASMIWGYGPIGYGAWRTKRVLDSTPSASERLADVANVVAADGAAAGFRAMRDIGFKYLKVAFGTKYLYFVSRAHAPSTDGKRDVAPVLDDVVRRWMWRNAGVRLRIDTWNLNDYVLYLELLDSWGSQVDLPRDTVEELIFRYQISVDGSRIWREGWLDEFAASEGAIADAANVLAGLVDALAVLPGESDAVDEAATPLRELSELIERRRHVADSADG